jgi:hypothetical protein
MNACLGTFNNRAITFTESIRLYYVRMRRCVCKMDRNVHKQHRVLNNKTWVHLHRVEMENLFGALFEIYTKTEL